MEKNKSLLPVTVKSNQQG